MGNLFEALLSLHDQRDARGLCNALVTALVFVVSAKLVGEDGPRGIAQWVKAGVGRLVNQLPITNHQSPIACSQNCLTTISLYGKIPHAAAEVAQLVEHATENCGVRSSTLRLGTYGVWK